MNAALMLMPAPGYESKFTISLSRRRVIVPPYCGVPSLFHQLPAVVVAGVVVDEVAVVVRVVVVCREIEVVVVCIVVDIEVEVDVELLQEASNRAVTIRKLKQNQISLLFISILLF